jgi:catechol 2,3-dioxygenase-like lactoylglutathione lyase family enzyme
MPQFTGILETALYVSDVHRSVEFYQRVLNAKPMVVQQDRFAAMSIADKSVLLLFLQGGTTEPMELPGGTIPPHDGHGQLHMAFACTAEELPKWEMQLASQNVAIEGRVKWERGGISIYFRDPDENLLEIITPGVWPIY